MIKTRTIIIAAILLLSVGFMVLIYYRFLDLHMTESSPSSDTIATSQNTLKYSFSMPISKNPVIKIQEGYKYAYIVTDNILSIQLQTPLEENAKLSLQFTVRSATGTKTYSKVYTAKYIDFSEQNSDTQKQQISSSDSFETEYSLIQKLPYKSAEYEIDYRYPSSESSSRQKLPIIITSLAVDDSLGDTPSQMYLDAIKSSRDQALSYLKNNGYDTDKYSLYVTEPYLLDEYGAKNVSDLDSF